MKGAMFLLGAVLLSPVGLTQASSSGLPCSYSGELLRNKTGKPVRLTSDEMKSRATSKVDVGNFMSSFDFHGTIAFEVLVAPSGKVACLEAAYGHPYVIAEVRKALQQWVFKPAEQNEKPVASLGLIEFYLCNISCGEKGMSMSLLK